MKICVIKLTSALLALLMCFSLLVACAKDDDAQSEDTSAEEVSTTNEVGERYDANGYLMDDLPEMDLNAREFNILMWSQAKAWEFVDTSTYPTAKVDQALYAREKNVESRFNVKIEVFTQSCDWANKGAFIQHLANSVNVNDQAYDLVGQYGAASGDGALQGLYQNLAEVEHINTNKPWWPKKLTQSTTVNGKVYGLTGDISPTLIRSAECMFLNLDLWEAYNLDEHIQGSTIYDIVRENKWTLEMMKTLALNHTGDNEGIEEDQRIYGLSLVHNVSPDGFLYAGGYVMARDINGRLSLSPELETPTFSDWFDEIQALYSGKRGDILNDGGLPVFAASRSVFHVDYMSAAQTFAQKGVLFTSLPMPMRSEDQGGYYTCPSMYLTIYSIPIDVKSYSESGLIMEALASEAYRTVSDVIYYDIFQTRYNSAGNEDSAEMFDIVFDSIVLDVSRVFATPLGSFATFRNAVNDPQLSWSTVYASAKQNLRSRLASLLAYMG